MKIINVIQRFNVGGIQKLLLEYLRFFKNNNEIDYRVVVLEKNEGSLYDKICEEEGLKIEYLNCYFSKNKHYYIRTFHRWWTFNHSLTKYLKKQKPDVVHTHNTRMLYLIESCIKKTKSKYKWFHTLHSDPFAVDDKHIPVAKRVFDEYGVTPICLNSTQFEKANKRYDIKKCTLVYNAINFANLKNNIINKWDFKKSLGIDDDSFIIGSVGRVDPIKNYDFFIDVIKETLSINPKTIGMIVGDDTGASVLKEKIKRIGIENNIIFTGPRNDVGNFYNIFDRFLLTSKSESSSLVALEAQCFNLQSIFSLAIPQESICLKDRIILLDLQIGAKEWAKSIVAPQNFAAPKTKLDDYNINNTSTKLLKIYNSNSFK